MNWETHWGSKMMTDNESFGAVAEMTQNFVQRAGGNEIAAAVCAKLMAGQNGGDVCLRVEPEEIESLTASGIVSIAPDDAEPLVFDARRRLLYTRRNWRYEQNVLSRIREMIADPGDTPEIECPADGVYAALEAGQRAAIRIMGNHRFSIITGGPGTGKTYTIARAVKLIQRAYLGRGTQLRLALAAPTGKAAARVRESIQSEAAALELDLGEFAPCTLHALLRSNYDLVTFAHDRKNPLPLDWLIVDEASMIDLPLMSKLLDALPENCRLTLVGDAHQLSSVEPGRVFGDLCAMAELQECVIRLTASKRLEDAPEIFQLAECIKRGDSDAALAQLKSGGSDRLRYVDPARGWEILSATIRRKFENFARQATAEGALAALNNCRILCALRPGKYGCERLNALTQKLLGDRTPVPMMITRKDHALGVSNGDVGVVMPEDPDVLYLGKERAIPLALLNDRETAFATTIHKSQGSEFESVIVVLPPVEPGSADILPLLTRELLYTAITRTKGDVFLCADDGAILTCCDRRIERCTGLMTADVLILPEKI